MNPRTTITPPPYTTGRSAAPPGAVRRLGWLRVIITSGQRPFAVTNLGQLDGNGVQLQGADLEVESFFGAVTGIVDSSVLTVDTIGGSMPVHLLAAEADTAGTAIPEDAERAMRRLVEALDR